MDNTHYCQRNTPDSYEHLISASTRELLKESGVVLEIEDQLEASTAYPLHIAAFDELFPLNDGDSKLDIGWQENFADTKNIFTHINNWVKRNDSRCKTGKIHSWLIIREDSDLTGNFLYTDTKSVDLNLLNKGAIVGFVYGDDDVLKEIAGSLDKGSSETVLKSALKDVSLFYNNQAIQASFRHNGLILDAIKNIPKDKAHSAVLEDRFNKAIINLSLKNR